MTSGAQPFSSGAPTPVQGVTGGPAVLGGQISNDPQTGNVVVAPNPGQVLQVRKGNNPTALQVYEYFHTNTDYSRIALNSQTGGPFSLAVETAPSTVIRALNITANGNIAITAGGVLQLGSNGNTQWQIPTNGNFLALTDNTLDIGQPTFGRPRNLYIAGVGVFGGNLTSQSITTSGTGTTGDINAGGRLVSNFTQSAGPLYLSADISTGHNPNLGGAPALPANPGGYFHWFLGGSPIVVPWYNTAT